MMRLLVLGLRGRLLLLIEKQARAMSQSFANASAWWAKTVIFSFSSMVPGKIPRGEAVLSPRGRSSLPLQAVTDLFDPALINDLFEAFPFLNFGEFPNDLLNRAKGFELLLAHA